MNSLLELGFSNALAALVLAPIAAWVGWRGRRPALAHGLWLLVLLKLVTPPLWTWSVPVPAWSPERPVYAVEVGSEPGLSIEQDQMVLPVEDTVWELVAVTDDLPAALATVEEAKPIDWRLIFGTVWALGTLVWGVVTWRRVAQFHRLLGEARPASSSVQSMTRELAHRLGLTRSPEVSMLPGSLSPFVWSLGGPARLLLPRSLWDSLDDKQRTTLLTHELAHLKRRDHWVRAVELLATGLFWWHPVVYWARRGLREAEEQCCDAWVVWVWPESAKVYATALLETIDFLAEARPAVPLPVAASGLGHVEQLKRRLTMILSGLTPHRLTFAGRIALVGLAAALLPQAPSLAQSSKEKETEKKQVTVTVDAPKHSGTITESKAFVIVTDDDDDDDKDSKGKAKKSEKEKSELKAEIKAKIDAAVRDAKEQASKARQEAGQARKQAEEVRKTITLRAAAQPSKPVSKEDQAALEKAQAELKEAQDSLAKAAKRFAELQMKVHGHGNNPVSVTIHGKPVEGHEVFFTPGGATALKGTKNFVIAGKAGETVDVKELPDGKGQVKVFTRVVEGKPVEVHEVVVGKKSGETFEIQTEDIDGDKKQIRIQGRVIGQQDGKVHTFNVPIPPVPPVPPVPPTFRSTGSSRAQDARIEAMEKQIKQLLDEVKQLKKSEEKERHR